MADPLWHNPKGPMWVRMGTNTPIYIYIYIYANFRVSSPRYGLTNKGMAKQPIDIISMHERIMAKTCANHTPVVKLMIHSISA